MLLSPHILGLPAPSPYLDGGITLLPHVLHFLSIFRMTLLKQEEWLSEWESLSRVRLFATPWTDLPGSSVHGILQARLPEWLPFPSPGVFPTQGSNSGLPRCRQTLYHLSHQGSQTKRKAKTKLCIVSHWLKAKAQLLSLPFRVFHATLFAGTPAWNILLSPACQGSDLKDFSRSLLWPSASGFWSLDLSLCFIPWDPDTVFWAPLPL